MSCSQRAWRYQIPANTIGADGLRTGMVAIVHLCGDLLSLNPHVHAMAPRGGWESDGTWVPVP